MTIQRYVTWGLAFRESAYTSASVPGYCSTPSGRINYLVPKNPIHKYASSEEECVDWCSKNRLCMASAFLSGDISVEIPNSEWAVNCTDEHRILIKRTNCLFYGPVTTASGGEEYTMTIGCRTVHDEGGLPCPAGMTPRCTRDTGTNDAFAEEGTANFDEVKDVRCGDVNQHAATCIECHAEHGICENNCVMFNESRMMDSSTTTGGPYCFECDMRGNTGGATEKCLTSCILGTHPGKPRCELRQSVMFSIHFNGRVDSVLFEEAIIGAFKAPKNEVVPVMDGEILRRHLTLKRTLTGYDVTFAELAESLASVTRIVVNNPLFKAQVSGSLKRSGHKVRLRVGPVKMGHGMTLMDSIGTVMFVPRRDLLDTHLFGGAALFDGLPPSCMITGAATLGYNHMVIMENSEQLNDQLIVDAGLDVKMENKGLTVASTVKAHFSSSMSSSKHYKAVRFQSVAGVRRHALDKGCASFDHLSPFVAKQFSQLPLAVENPGKQLRDSNQQGEDAFLDFWGEYNNFVTYVGSHVVVGVHTGARFQMFFTTTSTEIASREEMEASACSAGSRMGISIGGCTNTSMTHSAGSSSHFEEQEIIVSGGDPALNVQLEMAQTASGSGTPVIGPLLEKFLQSANETDSAIKIEWQPIWDFMSTLANTIPNSTERLDMKERARNLKTFYGRWLYKFDKPNCEEVRIGPADDPKTYNECLCGLGSRRGGFVDLCSKNGAICAPEERAGYGTCYDNCSDPSQCYASLEGVQTCDEFHYSYIEPCETYGGIKKWRYFCCLQGGKTKPEVTKKVVVDEGWGGCVGGSMQMIGQQGPVRVDQLKVGDMVHGMRGETSQHVIDCEVLAVHDVGDGVTVDHITPDHFVVKGDQVIPYGPQSSSPTKVERIYTVATTCDAVKNTNEVHVSAFSGAFCSRSLSWVENVELAGVLRDALQMAPWLNLAIYTDAPKRKWKSMLHPLCDALLKCLAPEECVQRECPECQELRDTFAVFMRDHVDPSYHAGIATYCRRNPGACLGEGADDDAPSHIARNNRVTTQVMVGSFVGIALFVLLVAGISAVVMLIRRRCMMHRPETPASESETATSEPGVIVNL